MSHAIHLEDAIEPILQTPPVPPAEGEAIGDSREGRAIRAFRLGRGPLAVSLIGGAHADEPTGPWMLRRLVGWLRAQPAGHPLLEQVSWYIIPHVNPDGEARNAAWFDPQAEAVDPAPYLRHVIREKPGDDIEFGFPDAPDDTSTRPETRAIYRWWREARRPFALHASLHSMAIASGPWFLIDAAWSDRTEALQRRCRQATETLGYRLFDWDREGEKGFTRIARGFCTRPDSRAMRQHFLDRGDTATADRFHPSSMETMRDLGDDCLTLVSEMPLLIATSLPDYLSREDPAWLRLREALGALKARASTLTDEALREAVAELELSPMPLADQMRLQLVFVAAGLRAAQRAPTR